MRNEKKKLPQMREEICCLEEEDTSELDKS